MRKLSLIVALSICLGGCAYLQSFSNPISKDSLAAAEAGYGVALSIAKPFRDACAARTIPPSCRPIVRQIQDKDAYAYAAILTARNFVKDNPTVDAGALISAAQDAVAQFKAIADASKGQ